MAANREVFPQTVSVSLVDRSGTPVHVTISPGPPVERICFTQGRHEQLVRRWRWYLKYDLQPENHVAIRRAIANALNDTNFQKITFQTIEDTQRVLTNVETRLGGNFEFDDIFIMHIILMTQQTTSPDPIDQQP
jgi:hypothetical protein